MNFPSAFFVTFCMNRICIPRTFSEYTQYGLFSSISLMNIKKKINQVLTEFQRFPNQNRSTEADP